MSNTKYEISLYSHFDHSPIRRRLERMALKGWLLESTGRLIWKYRRIEPQTLHFTLAYLPQISVLTPEPNEEQQTFSDFCEKAGWKLAAYIGPMQVLYNEQSNPVPVETDAMLQVHTIHSSYKKHYFAANIAVLLLNLYQLLRIFLTYKDSPITVLSNRLFFVLGGCAAGLILLSVIDILAYFTWYIRAKVHAEKYKTFLPPKGVHLLSGAIGLMVLISLLYFLLTTPNTALQRVFMIVFGVCLLVILAIVGFSDSMKKGGMSAATNFISGIVLTMILTFVVFTFIVPTAVDRIDDNVLDYPLVLEDLVELDHKKYAGSCQKNESPLLSHLFIHQIPLVNNELGDTLAEQWEIRYTVTVVKHPDLYSLCKDEILPDVVPGVSDKTDPALWGANEVHYYDTSGMHRYIACYDDRIINIWLGWNPTEEQIGIIAEKLGA